MTLNCRVTLPHRWSCEKVSFANFGQLIAFCRILLLLETSEDELHQTMQPLINFKKSSGTRICNPTHPWLLDSLPSLGAIQWAFLDKWSQTLQFLWKSSFNAHCLPGAAGAAGAPPQIHSHPPVSHVYFYLFTLHLIMGCTKNNWHPVHLVRRLWNSLAALKSRLINVSFSRPHILNKKNRPTF